MGFCDKMELAYSAADLIVTRAGAGTLGVIGSGVISGARYIMPLPGFDGVYHSLSLGADYKDFDEQIGFDRFTIGKCRAHAIRVLRQRR